MVFAVLLMALPVASYVLMFKPRDAEIKLAEEDIRARRDKLAALKQATAEVKDLPQEIEKLRKAISFFEGKLPEEKEMDKVLGEVWQIAEKNGLNTKSVRTMKAIPGDSYSEQPIRMVIVGSFGGFYTFLRSVEQLPRITRISEMTMEKDPKVEGQMTADLVLTIYFESQKSGPAVAVNK
jgi:type IV pilus assembly protein PilO